MGYTLECPVAPANQIWVVKNALRYRLPRYIQTVPARQSPDISIRIAYSMISPFLVYTPCTGAASNGSPATRCFYLCFQLRVSARFTGSTLMPPISGPV